MNIEVRSDTFLKHTFIIMMTERLSNTELKRFKQQICEFIVTIYYSFKARCRQKQAFFDRNCCVRTPEKAF